MTDLKHFSTLSLLTALSLALPGSSRAGSAGSPAPLQLGQQSYTFICGRESVQVAYVTTGAEHDRLPVFVVLTYRGQRYGLSEAVSASGARYIGHAGLNTAQGLEWWEHQGEGTLSSFRGDNASATKKILGCKMKM